MPPENAFALAEAISALLADPDRARTLGESGRERVSRHFTVGAMVDAAVAVYRGLGVQP